MKKLFEAMETEALRDRILEAENTKKNLKLELEARELWLKSAYAEITKRKKEEQALRVKNCSEHRYVPTNRKWQPINQSECMYCGDVRE